MLIVSFCKKAQAKILASRPMNILLAFNVLLAFDKRYKIIADTPENIRVLIWVTQSLKKNIPPILKKPYKLTSLIPVHKIWFITLAGVAQWLRVNPWTWRSQLKSQSEHMPRSKAQSPMGCVQEAANQCSLSSLMVLSLSLVLLFPEIN